MADYFPILHGRAGEFDAIDQVPDELAPHLLPIFDVAATTHGPIHDAHTFSRRAQDTLPRDMTIAVDAHRLPDPATGLRRPLPDIAEDLHQWGNPMLPVAHPHDSPARLADIRDAAALHGHGAVLRLDHTDDDAETRAHHLLSAIDLRADHAVLLLDAAHLRSEHDLTRAEPLVRKHLSWTHRHPWKAVVVAAGAMPRSIAHLPPDTPTPLRRFDLDLWQRLHDHHVRFADYGIAHPRPATGGWGPPPNLRYTDHDVWWTYRATRDDNGNDAIHDLCRTLVTADHWPTLGRHFSWGDEQIALRAARHATPGTARHWLAWGTSHHLAHVANHLGLPGAPPAR
ncbi:beta family protein [Micromonospora sp. RP3T]|uniref:beta family protein n=1 Tax=Micromonospora sp. RP3T TaxID=2135446 RepID=UPI000D1539B0|nr:beta family protein [Micromonospora sp. RP3T]PTA44978.1 hypothetical protein C8054_17460 [Micromonospora sp. RP3T]